MKPVYIATEDALSEAVAERLVEEVKDCLEIQNRIKGQGFGRLYRMRGSLYNLAEHVPVFLLIDLDTKLCASVLIEEWFPEYKKQEGFLFRVVVKEIEAWLMADRTGFSSFFRVPIKQMPLDPELIDDPKQHLIHLVKRYSPRDIKQDVVPDERISTRVGLAYNDRLVQFVRESWSPAQAAQYANSLSRTRQRLQKFCQSDLSNSVTQ